MLKWFSKRLKEAQEKDGQAGFTLIELLVVVIIIGILAAIAIPTFLAQRENAWEANAESDLRNAAAAATSCSADNDGSFATCDDPVTLTAAGYNKSEDVTLSFPVAATSGSWSGQTVNDLDDGTRYRFYTDSPGGGVPQGQVHCVAGDPDC